MLSKIHGERKEVRTMMLSTSSLSPLASLVFGILILIFPKFLNYFIAAYLIIIGIIGLGFIR